MKKKNKKRTPKTKKVNSEKEWREFEKIVAEIERKMAPLGAKVKSPDQLPDLKTGSPINVDGTIRMKVGSSEILIVLECRDRGRTEEVAWIRELRGRKEDTGASSLIAISSKGFKPESARNAKLHGIHLRKLSKVTASNLLDLKFEYEIVRHESHTFGFTFYQTIAEPAMVFNDEFLKSEKILNEAIFKIKDHDQLLTQMGLFESCIASSNRKFGHLISKETGESPIIEMRAAFAPGLCSINSSQGELQVQEFSMKFKLTKQPLISLNAIEKQVYSDEEDQTLFETYNFSNDNVKVEVDFDRSIEPYKATVTKFEPIEKISIKGVTVEK